MTYGLRVRLEKFKNTNIKNATDKGKIYFVSGESEDNVEDNYLYVDGKKYGVSKADLTNIITPLQEKVDGIRTDFDILKPWVILNTENITKINSTVEEQTAEIADLQEKVNRLNTWMELDGNKTGDKN